ncbi:MAG TPA: hypothetical protein VFU94_05855 [Conexibacter sp.]|nr:hypothetical protein [Conexibacter sp.]
MGSVSIGARLRACALLACCALAGAAAHADARVLRRNVAERVHIADITPNGVKHCQERELLPRGTDALQLALQPLEGGGPVVVVEALAGSRLLARGWAAAGWVGESLTVTLRPHVARTQVVTLCMTTPPGPGIAFYGRIEGTSRQRPGEPTLPAVQVTYLEGRVRPPVSSADRVAALLGALLGLLLP